MNKEKDIFDKIMDWKIFNEKSPLHPLKKLYDSKKDILIYIFFGGVTTVVNFIALALFLSVIKIGIIEIAGAKVDIGMLISNTLAWVVSVLVAFFTNRIWVFHAETKGIKDFFIQLGSFSASRIATLVIENIILWIFANILGLPVFLIKVVAAVVVVVLNYLFSKWFVFKKNKEVSTQN